MTIQHTHYYTLRQTMAAMQRTSAEYKAAKRELDRRKKSKRKSRPCRPKGYFTRYKKVYGMDVDDIAYLLKITHAQVHELERKGNLKRIIKLRGVK